MNHVIKGLIIPLLLSGFCRNASSQYEVDSAYAFSRGAVFQYSPMTFERAIEGKNIPKSVRNRLSVITIKHYNYEGEIDTGYMVVDSKLDEEILIIFHQLFEIKFPIEMIRPISEFSWSDDSSMVHNNTSCFNYRYVAGSKVMSKHAYGRAIDINPRFNPMIKNGRMSPPNGEYNSDNLGTITRESQVVKIFKDSGWRWGGDYNSLKDYQHFYRPGY